MTEQYLPTYIHDFLKDKNWLTRESTHYRFYYFPKSVAESEIESIVARQETSCEKVIAFLNVPKPDRLIEYYLYPSKEAKTKLMGDDWYAQAIYDEFRVHLLYTETIKPLGEHEDTHLLSLPWGLAIGFFAEGLAEHLVGQAWDGKLHLEHVREGYSKNIYPPLVDFLDHQSWLKADDSLAIYFYSLAGAFVSFLITTFDKDRFESFYRQLNRDNTGKQNGQLFQSIYGKNIEEVEIEFKRVI